MENIDPKKTPGSPQEAGQRMWEDSWRPEDKAMESAEDEELNIETVEDMERTKTPVEEERVKAPVNQRDLLR